MKQLPVAPDSLSHGRVKIAFDTMTEGDEERGFVPGYRFRIIDDQGSEVGHLNFRVGDSEHVRLAAGHIGYEIAGEHRGHGYAADACLAIAPWVSEVSETVLITVDPDNIPSIRTIERIGATFLDEVDVPEGDPHYLRGSCRKWRYMWKPTRMKPSDNSIVQFRRLMESDADIFFAAAFGDAEVTRFLQWDTHSGLEETKCLVDEMIGMHMRGEKYFWVARSIIDDRIVGLCSIKPAEDTAWLGFLVLLGEQRKGFGSAIVSAVEDVVLRMHGSVSAAVEPRNIPSINLLRTADWIECPYPELLPLLTYRKAKADKVLHKSHP